MKYLEQLKQKLKDTTEAYNEIMKKGDITPAEGLEASKHAQNMKSITAEIKNFEQSPYSTMANILVKASFPDQEEINNFLGEVKSELQNLKATEQKEFYPTRAAGDMAGFESQFTSAKSLVQAINDNGTQGGVMLMDTVEEALDLERIDFASTAIFGIRKFVDDKQIGSGSFLDRFVKLESELLDVGKRRELHHKLNDLRGAKRIINTSSEIN